ncbi:MAG: hypothetical protein J5905_02360 [Prevotella sp.]|nr:hypothetical protein [Prevotella sp.]
MTLFFVYIYPFEASTNISSGSICRGNGSTCRGNGSAARGSGSAAKAPIGKCRTTASA